MNIEVETYDQVLDRIANAISRKEPTSEMQAYEIRCAAKLMRELVVHNKDLIVACRRLDDLDWCIGYELTEKNHKILDEALALARKALERDSSKVTL